MKIRPLNIAAALLLGTVIVAGPAQAQERTLAASSEAPSTAAAWIMPASPTVTPLPAAFNPASVLGVLDGEPSAPAPASRSLAWHPVTPGPFASVRGSLDAQAAMPYIRPTASEKFHSYLYGTFGPSSFLRAAAIAGIDQAENRPPDWGQGAAGYGQRFASAFGQSLVDRTTVYGLGSLLHEDTKYYRCDCRGFGPRLKHALLTTLASRHGQDGHYIFSVPKLVAPYAGGMATLLWYPARYGPKDGFRSGNIGLAVGFGISVAREFIWSKL